MKRPCNYKWKCGDRIITATAYEYPELSWAYSRRQMPIKYTSPVTGFITVTAKGFYAGSGFR